MMEKLQEALIERDMLRVWHVWGKKKKEEKLH